MKPGWMVIPLHFLYRASWLCVPWVVGLCEEAPSTLAAGSAPLEGLLDIDSVSFTEKLEERASDPIEINSLFFFKPPLPLFSQVLQFVVRKVWLFLYVNSFLKLM